VRVILAVMLAAVYSAVTPWQDLGGVRQLMICMYKWRINHDSLMIFIAVMYTQETKPDDLKRLRVASLSPHPCQNIKTSAQYRLLRVESLVQGVRIAQMPVVPHINISRERERERFCDRGREADSARQSQKDERVPNAITTLFLQEQ